MSFLLPWFSLDALLGGVLIGLSAAMLFMISGRIAGISGIVGGLLESACHDWAWRLAFILGLLAAPWLWLCFSDYGLPAYDLPVQSLADWLRLIVAGLLVGFGTRLANGCTSGHGVCGMARLSPRSFVAVGIFLGSGMLTVFLLRHWGGL